ncbi:hypothetical protein H4S02_000769 [Coemansia sp. RSA 2611]|nr:hypothetical protein H4S02_000769 [Coemansia sp. RSA 2611]KAJ2715233.1 hypothetical protein H4R23_005631 [Coemansia sp. Cherry 401B]
MSSLETLDVLRSLTKRTTSKRERKERAKKTFQSLVRKPDQPKKQIAKVQPEPQVTKAEPKKAEAELRRSRNAATMRAADRMVSDKCHELHKEIIELMRAQKERRRPRIKRKHKLSYIDF